MVTHHRGHCELSASCHTVILTIVDSWSAHFVPPAQAPISCRDRSAPGSPHLPAVPCDMVSDRGPQFASQVWRSSCAALWVAVTHPQSSGQSERANRSLESALRWVSARNPASCSSFLPWVKLAGLGCLRYVPFLWRLWVTSLLFVISRRTRRRSHPYRRTCAAV